MINSSEFEGKVAVVTGAASGIGKEVVRLLQNAGARVGQLDIAFSSAEENFQYAVNVTDSICVNRAIDRIETQLGAIDYLVNAAGILRLGSLLECSDEDWQATFAVNTTGAFNVCRAVAKKMQPRKRGAIVAVSSNAAAVPRIGMGSYASSKAATSHLIKCLGLELAADNIRCNIVAPGSTDTPMQQQLWADESGPQKVIAGCLDTYRTGIPLKRIASAENIAEVILFLLSPAAVHITMETIVVDGGAILGK